MSRPASQAQIDYVEALAHEARAQVDLSKVVTMDDASSVIADLQQQIPLTDRTRKAIYAQLREAGKTKEDLCTALGIDSLSAAGTASEHDGARCKAWIRGFETEIRRVPAPSSFVDGLVAEQRRALPPRRPGNPFGAPPTQARPRVQQQAIPIEQPRAVEQPKPTPRPGAPRRPGVMNFAQPEPVVKPVAAVVAAQEPAWTPPARVWPQRPPMGSRPPRKPPVPRPAMADDDIPF